jgi:twinkle protein
MTHASPSRSNRTGSSFTAGTAAGAPPHRSSAPVRPLEVLTARTMALLEQRGLDVELCERLGVRSAIGPDGGNDWIAIPYRRGGRVVHHKYRRVFKQDGAPNFQQDRGARQCWWNEEILSDPTLAAEALIITEGELDAIAAMQTGFQRVLSVPNGAPEAEVRHEGQSNGKYSFLADTLPLMKGITDIILAVDSDRQGSALLGDLAKRLGPGRCRFVVYPEGCKDLLDVLNDYGLDAVAEAIRNAPFVHVPGICRMSELPPIPEAKPHTTDMPGLDPYFRIRLGDFSVVTGIPSCGKSTVTNDMACRIVEKHGWHVTFASFEQHPTQDHRRALRTWHAGKPVHMQSHEELRKADAWIDGNFAFVVPPEDGDEEADLDWLLDKIATAVVRYDSKLIIIDPWNEMDHYIPKDMTVTQYVSRAIKQMKKFARRWQVHLTVIAHPSKMARDKDGKIPKPTLYDISDSAHWYNKPDAGIVLHPVKDESGSVVTECSVDKSRYHDQIGKPGKVAWIYNSYTARFEAAK